jgi:hypothetical protein
LYWIKEYRVNFSTGDSLTRFFRFIPIKRRWGAFMPISAVAAYNEYVSLPAAPVKAYAPSTETGSSGNANASAPWPGPAYTLDLSPQALAGTVASGEKSPPPGLTGEATENASAPDGTAKAGEIGEVGECQTCANRKYVDGSDDPSVSFKSPTRLDPHRAAASVYSHEREHVSHERAAAEREDRKILRQSVSIHTGICPECGRVYVSGGETVTVSAKKAPAPAAEAKKAPAKIDLVA